MKNQLLSLTFLTILFVTISCKKEVKKEVEKSSSKVSYTLDSESAIIGWTAYKTTDKIAVKGEFKTLNLKIGKKSDDAVSVINSTEFNIPISSIFSNNEDRDSKLKQFFFGVMKNTTVLSGKIQLKDDTSGTLTVSMNGVTNSFPITYSIKNEVFTLSGTMNLQEWKGQAAIESLNKVCFDLHKAADGVSKTWDDVQIDASIKLINN